MNISDLAAKQKRAKFWIDFAANEIKDVHVKNLVKQESRRYTELLSQLWEKGSVSVEDEKILLDLERRLEQLNEEARLSC